MRRFSIFPTGTASLTLLRSFLVSSGVVLASACGLSCLGTAPLLVAAEPAESTSGHGEVLEPAIVASDREHWAWQPLQRPPLPELGDTAWPRNAVDHFILRQLQSVDLTPAGEADKSVLLRRLKYDLHGLPPTLQEREAYLSDTLPGATERLIDRLLGSPAYGERWSQHWLDLARFAETDGFEHDKVREGAWQYRDWVLTALNENLPYDQFVRAQLAGDQTGDPVPTMFCLAGPDMPDINEQDLRRHDKLNEITATVSGVLLAMQMQCAQCHDHKYDPISQADFYRLRAAFEPAVPLMQRNQVVHYLARQSEPAEARFYHRGDVRQPGTQLAPAVPRVAVAAEESHLLDPRAPREAFVDWLFAEGNPLTARVIVNRLWQQHFSRSLCENPSDFGVVTGGPSHPELLDWLAAELRDSGWDLKRLHRLLLTSATYRQASRPGKDEDWEQRLSIDPANEYFSRFNRRRLEGEAIRDALLAVGDQLDYRMHGPSVMPPLPAELLRTLLKGQWETSPDKADHARRSIYLFARRNLRYPLFEAFDRPDAGASCAVRDRSTTAIQSLTLLNSELSLSAAAALRDRVLADARTSQSISPSWERTVEQLFLRVLARQPTPVEKAEIAAILAGSHGNPKEGWLTVCVALLNTNEFIYVD